MRGGGNFKVELYLLYRVDYKNNCMTDIINVIKKMLTVGLTSSEKVSLSERQEMHTLLSEQWEEQAGQHIEDKVNPEQIWANIASVCFGKPKKKVLRPLTAVYSIAAVVALLIMGVWMARFFTDAYITVSATDNTEMLVVTLPDSSKVWLNVGSTIRYPKNFVANREVELDGEAFFSVTKRTLSSFRVLFDGACVEVKGTEFNVKSGRQLDEITLFRGKIVFSASDINALEMKPYEQVVYNVAGRQAKLTQVDAVEYDWRSTEFRFMDKPLKDLVEFLNRTYKVKIGVEDKMYENILFTGTIRKNETLEDVLEKVCISFNLHKQVDGNSIILY